MRKLRFTFLVDMNERHFLATLAERLQRTQSDAIRVILREKVQEMGIELKSSEETDSINQSIPQKA